MNELEAVANINFETYEYNPKRKSLSLIRVGTCGTLQPSVEVGSFCVSKFAVGLDNTIKFYEGSAIFLDTPLSIALKAHLNWDDHLGNPYTCACDDKLLDHLFGDKAYLKGITLSAPGFYGAQGRASIIQPYAKNINRGLSSFSFEDKLVLNYEMEAAPIYAFAQLLGHKAVTVCLVLANRYTDQFLPDYKPHMDQLIRKVINSIKVLKQ